MELLFLWIEDFRNIHQQGFSFSSKLVFTVEKGDKSAERSRSYHLKIERNHLFVELMPNYILNVTGIVGKNGAGKSSLLHCLKIITGQFARLTSPVIFSVLDHEKNIISTFYYHGGGISEMTPLTVSQSTNDEVRKKYKVLEPQPYEVNTLQRNKGEVRGLNFNMSELTACYYSSSFDSHPETIYDGIINISNNFKIEEFLKNHIKNEVKQSAKRKKTEKEIVLWPSHISEYHKLELQSVLRFLSYAERRKTGLIPDLPKTLVVSFNFGDYESLIENPERQIIPITEDVKTIHKKAAKLISQSQSESQRFHQLTMLCVLYYYLRWHINNSKSQAIKHQLNDLQKLASDFNFEHLFDVLTSIINLPTSSSRIMIARHVISRSFSNTLEKVKIISTSKRDSKTRFEFKIENSLWPVLSAVYNLSHIEDINFIDYDWGEGISTGEEAFLRHFARLNDIRPSIKGRTLWLFIDEGDLYFHPQWQKSYFDNLQKYIGFLFHNKTTQIFITTHSPFIVSDLPKQHLIFLKKNDDKECIVDPDQYKSDTFGANIHELFSNSFFIHDGLMGEFAKQKISDAIAWCNSNEPYTEQQAAYFKSLVGIIGEPLIKYKLAEMVAARLGENTETARLQSQRDEIEKRLKQLKNNDPNKT